MRVAGSGWARGRGGRPGWVGAGLVVMYLAMCFQSGWTQMPRAGAREGAAGAGAARPQGETTPEPVWEPSQELPQQPPPAAPAGVGAAQAASPEATSGGVIRGTVKAGAVPLPGVAVTATNTLTGKRYATATDIAGTFVMAIPRNGRYVVRTELAAFASETREVLLNAAGENGGKPEQVAEFGMQLASRVAEQDAAQVATASVARTGARGSGMQALSVLGGGGEAADASAGGGNAGAQMPSLGGLDAGAAQDSIAVSGQVGQTNGMANFNEDEIRQRVEDAIAQARRQGGATGDMANAVAGMLGGMMGPGGFGGGPGGGGRGGRGGGGRGGFGAFNPTQPHGGIFYAGGFGALNATNYSLTGAPVTKPSYNNNRFGVTFTGSPYLPGLTKPNTKQFVFLNVTGMRNINPLNLYAAVPTLAERSGDFSGLTQTVNGQMAQTPIYDPATGQQISCNGMLNVICAGRQSPQAVALLRFYPAPNVAFGSSSTQRLNYQTITTAGQNSTQASLRFVRNFGQATGLGGFGGGRGGRQAASGPKTLRQNINFNGSYSHSASDAPNVFLPLGGASQTDGYGISAGYTVGYGRLTNNASVNWNRSHATARNYFTNTSSNPAGDAGIAVPSQGGAGAHPAFYNGLPGVTITNFSSLNDAAPRDSINQTISISDFVSWSHKKHNLRFGVDLRRVHADVLGGGGTGGNPLGTFVFSDYATLSPADRDAVNAGSTVQPHSGAGFADFLLGLPQQTKIQAGLNKVYLRANVYDWYAQDDWRLMPGLTLNLGLRYEYFSPYVEKNNRLVNLDHNADFTQVDPVQPGAAGQFGGRYPRSLVNPDRTLYSPRLGLAWRPKWGFAKSTVVRAGYGINYNTGQFATFAQSLAFQPPFAVTQTNVLTTLRNQTGCTLGNMTLANGFGCSTKAIQNNYSVNKDYRLGRVQVWNLDVQRSLPMGVVLNVGYNGSLGGNLDIVRAPNHTTSTVTTANAQAFTFEDSIAYSRFNTLVVNARKRMQKGISLQATYRYGHSIDNASSIGGSGATIAQNDQRLDLEEGNSAFDRRHEVTGNWVFELPFGPNRAFFSKGGRMSKALDGFSASGDFDFATGLYFTPQYDSTAAQIAAGGNYTLRPDRVPGVPIRGSGSVFNWFNKAAFASPANGFGTASRNSIEGPGTVGINASLSKTVALGETRSFEARVTANNVFNTVQYSRIDTALNSATFGQVTGTAGQRALSFTARYRF